MISPSNIMWRVYFTDITDPFELFRKKTRKKLRSALIRMDQTDYRFMIEPMTDELLDRFIPLYTDHILKKESGKVFDVKKSIHEGQKVRPYFMLSLYHQNNFLGGIIFSDREDFFTTAFKVFPKSLSDIDLPLNITFLAEYYLFEYAIKQGKEYIKHGRDRNMYGIHSNPGLAMFKLQIGGLPYVGMRDIIFDTFDPPKENTRDILVFHGEQMEQKITHATLYLYVTDVAVAEVVYGPLFKTNIVVDIIDIKK